MALIPYALSYTAFSTGSVVKSVRCESCGEEYHYLMTRQVEGEGTSLFFLNNRGAKKRAKVRSRELLMEELESSCDSVPCPSCGWYQMNMVVMLRQQRWSWMKTVGWLTLLPAAVCLLMVFSVMSLYEATEGRGMVLTWLTRMAILVGVSLALFLGRCVGARLYKPNAADVVQRKELGQSLSLSKADFLKMKDADQNRNP